MALLRTGGGQSAPTDTEEDSTPTRTGAAARTGLASNTGQVDATSMMNSGPPVVGYTDGGDLSAPRDETTGPGGTQNEVVTSDPSGQDTVTADNPTTGGTTDNTTTTPTTGGSGGFLPELGGLFAVLMAVVAALYVTLGGD